MLKQIIASGVGIAMLAGTASVAQASTSDGNNCSVEVINGPSTHEGTTLLIYTDRGKWSFGDVERTPNWTRTYKFVGSPGSVNIDIMPSMTGSSLEVGEPVCEPLAENNPQLSASDAENNPQLSAYPAELPTITTSEPEEIEEVKEPSTSTTEPQVEPTTSATVEPVETPVTSSTLNEAPSTVTTAEPTSDTVYVETVVFVEAAPAVAVEGSPKFTG